MIDNSLSKKVNLGQRECFLTVSIDQNTHEASPVGKGGMAMFEKEQFIEECRAAVQEHDTHAAVRELVARAVVNRCR